jgi:endonuclease YncB( thermonuclease family)
MKRAILAALGILAGPALAQHYHPVPHDHKAAERVYVASSGGVIRWGQIKLRLKGVDVPETYYSECAAEAKMGWNALKRLQDILDDGAEIRREITEDKRGNSWATATLNGRDVAEMLLQEGLARPLSDPRLTWCHKDPTKPHRVAP